MESTSPLLHPFPESRIPELCLLTLSAPEIFRLLKLPNIPHLTLDGVQQTCNLGITHAADAVIRASGVDHTTSIPRDGDPTLSFSMTHIFTL